MPLKPGDNAPDVTLLDQNGEKFSLSQSLKARKVWPCISSYPKTGAPAGGEAGRGSVSAAWSVFLRVATNARDPYPALAEARRATPVLREDANGHTSVLVFRHEDVGDVLRDASTFSSSILSEGLGQSS